MTARRIVLGQEHLTEDDLRLPRPPGVIRRFWARHPLLCDILLAVLSLLLAVPGAAVQGPRASAPNGWGIALFIVLTLASSAVLVWRRRRPVLVFVVALLPSVLAPMDLASVGAGPAALIALYSIAVYRDVRSCWVAFAAAATAIAANALARIAIDPSILSVQLNVDISGLVALLLGALIGVNVGNRRRYLDALIDRSRQLMIERDQQARLAAAAERTRIAREMHDIVSHSLTVVVALAEGVVATTDPERAREAGGAIAATAREALGEMRTMLGVLRSEGADHAPLGPVLDASIHDLIDAARSAGFPVTLTTIGEPWESSAHRLALLRIVQEGLTNAMRYSRDPRMVTVSVAYQDDVLRVVIENDGGHDGPSVGAGWGLQGLQERAAALDGSIAAGFAAPGLWRLTAELPKGARS